jgi:hypothetical protein
MAATTAAAATAAESGRTRPERRDADENAELADAHHVLVKAMLHGLVDCIIGAETGGDPNAPAPPDSSASGPSWFIDK